MTSKFGFTKMDINEFETWISNLRVARTIIHIQEHHTWSPSYINFKGNNHFDLQQGMKSYHVSHNGWMDIGQHFTTFPDGTILTGRNLENTPACILGFNSHAICIENLGDFDTGKDLMTAEHKNTIVRITAALCKKFGITVNSDNVVYHHWFNLTTGIRNNGTGNNKTCPGTNFFGGNKVENCNQNFLPLVSAALNGVVPQPAQNIIKYVAVTADSLNIREDANAQSKKVTGVEPATLGAILRVYGEKNGWYKISASQQHWVNGSFTKNVTRATVNATTLNVRSGPGTNFPKVSALTKNQEVFIVEESNGWCKISNDNKWVKKEFLS
ncbi:SH3 domain-containing protein [Pedobacter borealis]|uniref:SH3 domain-containing protein n=1 Tax=Pedobacter borealis TaxID=475254 RepID=UPI000493A3EB|nr:SH3 domain-containing protein [Pedobacter borealis]